jgi:hypothetical protein
MNIMIHPQIYSPVVNMWSPVSNGWAPFTIIQSSRVQFHTGGHHKLSPQTLKVKQVSKITFRNRR